MFKNKYFIKYCSFLLLILLCIPVVIPYFHLGYFPTHDGEWAVVRLGDMFRILRDLQFPPRMSGALNFGYGYPLFNFTYPFPYYLGILFYIPLHSFIGSIKLLFALSVFLSAIFMYIAASKLWGNRMAGFVSAIFYIYFPYRMVDLYVRGSLGESIAFVLFPVIFYFTLLLFDAPFRRGAVVVLSLLIATLVLTHNIMAVLFMIVFLIFMVGRIVRERRFDVLQSLALCLFLGFGVSFFFWFPALFEKSNILLSKIPIADRNLYFVKLSQLVFPSWGYAPPTASGGFSYQLGIGQLLATGFAVIILLFQFFKNKFSLPPARFYAFVILIIYTICLMMMFSFSSIIWNLPLLREINYPWILLSQLGFLTALLAGFIVVQSSAAKYLVFILAGVAFVTTISYAKPQNFTNYTDQYYLTNEATTTSSSELMPLWVKDLPTDHFKDKVEVVKGSAQISNIVSNSKFLKFSYKADSDVEFRVNTIYYPGWRAYINGEEVPITHDNSSGVMQISSSQYRNSATFYFGETPQRTVADIISVVAILVVLFVAIRPILVFR